MVRMQQRQRDRREKEETSGSSGGFLIATSIYPQRVVCEKDCASIDMVDVLC